MIQCIPTSEMSYATNSRNVDSISIECCHKDDTGVFEQETYDSVVKLAAWLWHRDWLYNGSLCNQLHSGAAEAWNTHLESIIVHLCREHPGTSILPVHNSSGITGASFASGCDRSGYSDGKERTEAGGKCRDIPGNE